MEPRIFSGSEPPVLEQVHCPYDNTSAGNVPGGGFALARLRGGAHADTYHATAMEVSEHALRPRAHNTQVALRRANLSAARVTAGLRSRSKAGVALAARTLVDMLTVQSNSVPYLNDFTNANGDTLKPSSDGSRIVRATLARNNVRNIAISEDYKSAVRAGAGDCEDVAETAYANYWQFSRATHFAPAAGGRNDADDTV